MLASTAKLVSDALKTANTSPVLQGWLNQVASQSTQTACLIGPDTQDHGRYGNVILSILPSNPSTGYVGTMARWAISPTAQVTADSIDVAAIGSYAACNLSGTKLGLSSTPTPSLLVSEAKALVTPNAVPSGSATPSQQQESNSDVPIATRAQAACVAIWNSDGMSWKSAAANVETNVASTDGTTTAKCQVTVSAGADLALGGYDTFPCLLTSANAYECGEHATIAKSEPVWNAHLDASGKLTLLHPPRDGGNGSTVRAPTYKLIDGYIIPFDSHGSLLPGLTYSGSASGTCSPGSESVSTRDAYRCFSGNFVYDPCFAAPDEGSAVSYVACPDGAGAKSFKKLTLTTNLARPVQSEPRTPATPGTLDVALLTRAMKGNVGRCTDIGQGVDGEIWRCSEIYSPVVVLPNGHIELCSYSASDANGDPPHFECTQIQDDGSFGIGYPIWDTGWPKT